MSNIYLKVTIKKTNVLKTSIFYSKFTKFVTRSVFRELQLTHISLNFKTSCCSLKTRGLEASVEILKLLRRIMTF